MGRRPYETEIGRAMQQLARAVHYQERARARADHANRQVAKWATAAFEAGLPLRRVANYLGVSHATAHRIVTRYRAAEGARSDGALAAAGGGPPIDDGRGAGAESDTLARRRA